MGRESTEDTASRVGESVFNNYNRNPEGDASRAADVMMRELNKVEARNPSAVNQVETAVLTDPNLKPILPAIELAYQKNRNGYSGDDGQLRVSSSAVLADLNSEEPLVRQSARAYQRAFNLDSPMRNGTKSQDMTASQVEAKIRDLSEGEVNEKIKEYKKVAKRNSEEQTIFAASDRMFKPIVPKRDTDLFGFVAARTGGSDAIEKRDLDGYLRAAEKYNQWKHGSSRYKRTHDCPVRGEDQIFFSVENQKAVKALQKLWKSDTVEDISSDCNGKKAIARTDLYDFTVTHGKKTNRKDNAESSGDERGRSRPQENRPEYIRPTYRSEADRPRQEDFRPVFNYNRESDLPRSRQSLPYDTRDQDRWSSQRYYTGDGQNRFFDNRFDRPSNYSTDHRDNRSNPYDYRSRGDQNYYDYNSGRDVGRQWDSVTVQAVSARDYDYYRRPQISNASWGGNDSWSQNNGTFGTNCFPWLNQSNSYDRPYYPIRLPQIYNPWHGRDQEQNQNRGFLGLRIGGFSLGIGL